MRRVEDSNQEFLEDVTHTIDESMETKEQLEKDISSLRSNFDDDNSEDL
jgi:hypothetical protein